MLAKHHREGRTGGPPGGSFWAAGLSALGRGAGFSLAGKGPNSQRSPCEPHPAFAPTAVSLAESHPQTPHTEAPTPRPQGGTAFGVGP